MKTFLKRLRFVRDLLNGTGQSIIVGLRQDLNEAIDFNGNQSKIITQQWNMILDLNHRLEWYEHQVPTMYKARKALDAKRAKDLKKARAAAAKAQLEAPAETAEKGGKIITEQAPDYEANTAEMAVAG